MADEVMSKSLLLALTTARLVELDRNDPGNKAEIGSLHALLEEVVAKPERPEVLLRRELWEAGLDVLRCERDMWRRDRWVLRLAVEPGGEVFGCDVADDVVHHVGAEQKRHTLPSGKVVWFSQAARDIAEDIADRVREFARRAKAAGP